MRDGARTMLVTDVDVDDEDEDDDDDDDDDDEVEVVEFGGASANTVTTNRNTLPLLSLLLLLLLLPSAWRAASTMRWPRRACAASTAMERIWAAAARHATMETEIKRGEKE